MNDILVRAATTPELPAAASALADAFADDPSFGFIPADERARRVRAYMSEAVTHGWLVEVALDGDRVLGAGLWEPPGRPRPSILASARHARGMIRALGPHWFAGARIDRVLARHRPPVPHWFLGYLGVAAAAQGRGVGRALLEHRLADIDAPVYLEAATDRAAALYRRLGFVDLGRFSGRHMPAVGMWRPAP